MPHVVSTLANQAEVLDGLFRFRVGDWVRPAGHPDLSAAMILERHVYQWSGATRLLYGLRMEKDGNITPVIALLTEDELEPNLAPSRVQIVPGQVRDSLLSLQESLEAQQTQCDGAELKALQRVVNNIRFSLAEMAGAQQGGSR